MRPGWRPSDPDSCAWRAVPAKAWQPVSQLDELLPQADIVVLATPLTAETRHLMDAGRIARMKRGALLVNAARGPVVDTDALVQALEDRKIRAAIDVTDPEPLPRGASALEGAQPAAHAACGRG